MNSDRVTTGLEQFAAHGQATQDACDAVISELEKQTKSLRARTAKVRALRQESAHMVKEATGSFSRTALMQKRRIARGKCADCGDEDVEGIAKPGGSMRLGVKCLAKRARYKLDRKTR